MDGFSSEQFLIIDNGGGLEFILKLQGKLCCTFSFVVNIRQPPTTIIITFTKINRLLRKINMASN